MCFAVLRHSAAASSTFFVCFQQSSQTHTFKVTNVPSGGLFEPSLSLPAGLGAARPDWFFEGFEEVSNEDMGACISWLLGDDFEEAGRDPKAKRDDGALGNIGRLL